MPRINFTSALTEFESNLTQIELNLSFIESAQWFRPRVGRMLKWADLDAESIRRSQQFMSQRDVQIEVISRGLLITTTGTFEQFVRRLIRETVAQINQESPRYNDISPVIILQNRLRTGHALSTISEPPDHLELDYELLCENLGTCTRGKDSVVLNADAFAYFVSTLTPLKLENVLGRLGYSLDWDDIGRNETMQELLGTTGARQSGIAAKDRLKDIIKDRNLAAHTGSGGKVIDFDAVHGALKFLSTFGSVLSVLLEDRFS